MGRRIFSPALLGIDRLARLIYEESRQGVSGRPRFEHLDLNDAFDVGMLDKAREQARRLVAEIVERDAEDGRAAS